MENLITTTTPKEWFKKTFKRTNAGCQEFKGKIARSHGYPVIKRKGKTHLYLRYLWEKVNGKIPAGQVLRHKCDNPKCVNLDHVQLGTHADNVADRVARNRSAKGERNGRAKLNEHQVREINQFKQFNICLEKENMRIIFVGVHNKEGMEPLDSKSRSGKMIDRVIAGLQTEVGLFEADFVKTNLFDLPYFPQWQPERGMSVINWSNRVGRTNDDLIILLGACVHDAFRNCKYPNLVRIGHPSGVWSKLKQEEYIINACIKVSEILGEKVGSDLTIKGEKD